MRLCKLIFVLCIAVIITTGCTGYGKYLKVNQTLPATNPSTIKVYATTTLNRDYQSLGYLSVFYTDAGDKGDYLRNELKSSASKIGADAIVGFKLTSLATGGSRAEGIAIKYK
jgi:hypothetical protein